MFLIIISLFVVLLYVLSIKAFGFGWANMPTASRPENKVIDVKISVVIACKNEEKNLPNLLLALQKQSYPHFELILTNDHSTDATKSIMENAKTDFKQLTIIDATLFGKKNALRKGVNAANGECIVTTDADCVPQKDWLKEIANYYGDNCFDLLICPVAITQYQNVFSQLQAMEFACLIGVSGGASEIHHPIMCNGANLAFKKTEWLKSRNELQDAEISGDDIFLLQSIKKRGGKIDFLKSERAIVETTPASTLSEFIHQRKRWAGKSPSYTDKDIILTACVVFSVCLFQLILLVAACIDDFYLFPFFLATGIKFVVDVEFLWKIRKFFNLKNFWVNAILLSLLFPFYVVFIAVSALLFKPVSWK